MNRYAVLMLGMLGTVGMSLPASAQSCTSNSILCVKDDFNNWLSERNRNVSDYVFGSAVIKGGRDSGKFSDALSAAYIEALSNAHAEIAKKQALKQSVTTLKRIVDDDMEDEEQAVSVYEAKLESITKKLMAWTEGVLDEKLTSLGVDKSLYTQCPVEKRKVKLLNMIKVSAVEKAGASTAGYLPAQTFVACDNDGSCSVGVAVSVKVQTLRLINNIKRAGANYRPEQGRDDLYKELKDKIAKKQDFMNDLGVRLIYDGEGYPVFVAFGQASVSSVGGKMSKQNNIVIAEETARQSAHAQLSMLFNSSVRYEQSLTTKAVSSVSNQNQYDEGCEPVAYDVDVESEKVMRKLNSEVRSSSVSNIKGIVNEGSWYKDEGGYQVVGVIATWSPKTAKQIQEMKNIYDVQKKVEEKKVEEKQHKEGYNKRGISTDVYDF